ncbi:unnamed protein product [Phytophthora fragariaefolia]|uniref:Unnamed protein product n=1 Tax=Phytophthora fragariaefolia TaxID=1490495 RepID=A0A9W6U037_9STRA|nr:unnamed protein product [Phytophthora fragariaefolia]
MAQLENRNISLQELHQSTNLERDSWSAIRDKERIIAWMTADYHRDAGNRQLVLRRCYDLTAQIRQLSDAIAMGNASTHQLRKRQLADKDNEIRRHLRITRMSPVVSEFQRLSRNAREGSDDEASLAPLHRPRRTAAANCNAIQRLFHAGESERDSAVLGEAVVVSSSSGHGRQASSGSTTVSSPSAPSPSFQVTSTSPTQASQDSIVDLASVNSPVSSSMLAEDLEGADSSGVESSSTTKQTEAASTLASLSGAYQVRRDSSSSSWQAPSLVESSDSSGDESTLADPSKSQAGSGAGSGSPPLASPTLAVRPPQVTTSAPISAAAKAPVPPKTPPPARSPVRPATSTPQSSSASKAKAVIPARSVKDASKPKPASKAKPTAAIRSAKDGSKPKSAGKPSTGKAKSAASDTKARTKSDGGVPLHHVDVKVLVARAAASARLDSRDSGPMKRLRELPVFLQGFEALLGEDNELLCCFGDHGEDCRCLFFVDDSVLEVCPPVEKGKRSKKPGSLLEVLSYEWCNSRGVVREDILLALWERMHWIVKSSVNVWLAEAFLASERTSRIDYEFTALWESLKDYLMGRKQWSDLLRLTVKVLGDAVVGAVNNKIDGLPAPLVDTEVCFDPAIPFCPP